MADIIDFSNYYPKVSDEERELDLPLLSVFYFQDEYSELVDHLPLDIRYAMVIMVYLYLEKADEDGLLEINNKGFTISNEACEALDDMIHNAIQSQERTLN